MKNYENIKAVINNELNVIEYFLEDFLSFDNNFLLPELKTFLIKKSKKIRSIVSILFIKALFGQITKKQLKTIAITELIHNASLLHDDVIDEADTRRNLPSVNNLYGNSIAVITGDYILSVALNELIKINNSNVTNLFIKGMHNVCKGEFEQNFSKYKIPSFEEYIKKSEYKTAELFKVSLSGALLSENQNQQTDIANEFCKNFGLIFQINDDLTNFLGNDKSKPHKSDFKNGIYTAPVIFWSQKNNIKQVNSDDYEKIKNSFAIKETIGLLDFYYRKILDLLSSFSDNQYKIELINLCKEIQKADNV